MTEAAAGQPSPPEALARDLENRSTLSHHTDARVGGIIWGLEHAATLIREQLTPQWDKLAAERLLLRKQRDEALEELAGLRETMQSWPKCPDCECRLGTGDPERRECGCTGPCTMECKENGYPDAPSYQGMPAQMTARHDPPDPLAPVRQAAATIRELQAMAAARGHDLVDADQAIRPLRGLARLAGILPDGQDIGDGGKP